MIEDKLEAEDARKTLVAALKKLGRRDYFEEELRRRLLHRGHPPAAVEAALERCRQMGYLDDCRIAGRFVELRAGDRGWGPARVRAELRARGVDESISDAASRLPSPLYERAMATALRKAEVRTVALWWRGREGRLRMVSSLVRRGFESQEARKAVEGLAAEREAQEYEGHDQQGDP